MNSAKLSVAITSIILVASVLGASFFMTRSASKKESHETVPVRIEQSMTVAQFGALNGLDNQTLKQIFTLSSKEDLEKPVVSFALTPEEIIRKTDTVKVLGDEDATKDWNKIPLKFGLWFSILGLAFFLIRTGRLAPNGRKGLYLLGTVLFGVLLGADPSPMGPIKDAIALYGEKGVVFMPRMIALTIFLLLTVLANKFICSWGCQFGTLQDLLFRLNRNKKDNHGIIPQYRIPFAVSNTIRVLFFIAFTSIALSAGMDIIEPIDPFRIYKPAMVTTMGWTLLVFLLGSSLVIYRPWCHLLCPFGLVGWLFEKISIFKIRVDRAACIGCEACSRACPSPVMEAILSGKNTIPDCFSCGTCISACPTGAISLSAGKREIPATDAFTDKKEG